MTVPRTVGLMPRCRLRPALPHLTFWCDWLPTTPMVARHSARTLRRSPLGSLSVTRLPSRAVIWALVPALRAIVVVQERNVRRAVRVVLYRCDRRRHPVLVALEDYEAVAPLVPATDVAGGNSALVVVPPPL